MSRGRTTQRLVADWFTTLWPTAYSSGASEPGKDVRRTPGASIEVKATSAPPMLPALRQAKNNADPGDIPLVVWRPNGYGPERMAEWVVALTLADATELLRRAGMGTAERPAA
jgi:hypothetical protein